MSNKTMLVIVIIELLIMIPWGIYWVRRYNPAPAIILNLLILIINVILLAIFHKPQVEIIYNITN